MDVNLVDLSLFELKYRQALLFTMIEGLKEGCSFAFSDDRDPAQIENDLSISELKGYRWAKGKCKDGVSFAYFIERQASKDGG